jgi:small nuclear ribonucleoprotein (snRNP)-like protein
MRAFTNSKLLKAGKFCLSSNAYLLGRGSGMIRPSTMKNFSRMLTTSMRRNYHMSINILNGSNGKADSQAKQIPVPHIYPEVEIEVKGVDARAKSTENLLKFNSKDIRELVDYAWNPANTEVNYSPSYPSLDEFTSLSETQREHLQKFLNLAQDFTEQGYTRQTLRDVLFSDEQNMTIKALESCVEEYFSSTGAKKAKLGQELHNMFINVGWLEKYWMFANLAEEKKATSFIPQEISRPYLLLSHLFGNHPEFTYYTHYVGAACGNTEEVQEAMKNVSFDNPESMVEWVNLFKPLYSFQPTSRPDALQAEKYFRFIHLAMEMVYSAHIEDLRAELEAAIKTGVSQEDKVKHLHKALDILYKIEMDQNAVFKTLKLGSDPKLYNDFVRPFIAGTWGKNCGTVFNSKGKFFESCHVEKWNESTSYGESPRCWGIWKKHVGQTGAGTSVRPICDEYAGGVSKLYSDADLTIGLVECLMTDNLKTVLDYSETMNPLAFMLTSFRAISRPYSHNKQIILAKQQNNAALPIILSEPSLLSKMLRCQTMALVHRLDHYNYVNAYINSHAANTAQLRSVATGGSQTTGFLPDLISSNIEKATSYLERYGESIENIKESNPSLALELAKDYDEYESTLQKFDKHNKLLIKKCKKIEEQDNSKLDERKSVPHQSIV